MIYLMALLVYLLIVAGLTVLQIYLSRMESPWPGRILPILSFVLTLAMIVGIFTYALSTRDSTEDPGTEETGTEIPDESAVEGHQTVVVASIPMTLMVFVWGDIPTALFTIIYFGERQKFRKKKQMEKMNIQDLE